MTDKKEEECGVFFVNYPGCLKATIRLDNTKTIDACLGILEFIRAEIKERENEIPEQTNPDLLDEKNLLDITEVLK